MGATKNPNECLWCENGLSMDMLASNLHSLVWYMFFDIIDKI